MPAASRWLFWPLNVALRPDKLVQDTPYETGRSLRQRLYLGGTILGFLLFNLFLYALPLTLAGFGEDELAEIQVIVVPLLAALNLDSPDVVTFVVLLLTNSSYLISATLLTLGTFHVGVWLSGASQGWLQSLRAVAYSSGIYLAIIFSCVWYISLSPMTTTASDLLIYLQAEFIYFFIDAMGARLELPIGQPEPVDTSGLSTHGIAVLVLLCISTVYYFVVLYAGARIGHRADRLQALISTTFVMISPALYVIGIIQFTIHV